MWFRSRHFWELKTLLLSELLLECVDKEFVAVFVVFVFVVLVVVIFVVVFVDVFVVEKDNFGFDIDFQRADTVVITVLTEFIELIDAVSENE